MALLRQARRRTLLLFAGLLALQGVALALIAALTFPSVGRWHTLDLSVYMNDSLHVLERQVPYRDFALEYPPLALFPFTLPRLVAGYTAANVEQYARLFLVQSVMLSTLIALVSGWMSIICGLPRSRVPALAVYSVLIAILAPLAPWRYDLFPALLCGLALLCVLRDRPASAGIWIGLGIAAKLYPVVLVPVFGVYYLLGRQYRALWRGALGLGVTLLLVIGWCVWVAPASWLSFLQYHEQRGLQIESVVGGALCFAEVLGWANASLTFNYGAVHFANSASLTIITLLPFVFGGLLLGMLGLFAYYLRGDRIKTQQERYDWLVRAVIAALLIFMVTNKVFSPQYLIWLLPFIPLLPLRQALLFVVICAITIVIFPFNYNRLTDLEAPLVMLLNVRNALVILALLLLARPSTSHPSEPTTSLDARVPTRTDNADISYDRSPSSL